MSESRLTLSRRRFVAGVAASIAVPTIIPRHVLGGTGHVAPSDKITLAHIGMGTQGFNELGDLLGDPAIQIVAVCDPVTSRRQAYRDRINQAYGGAACADYRDFRPFYDVV